MTGTLMATVMTLLRHFDFSLLKQVSLHAYSSSNDNKWKLSLLVAYDYLVKSFIRKVCLFNRVTFLGMLSTKEHDMAMSNFY